MDADAVRAEIAALHVFFEEWFTGRLPDTDGAFARCAEALAEDFVIVSPDGRSTPRAELLAGLRSVHGTRPAGAFAIWIENVSSRPLGGGLALVTYEEWQRAGDGERGRLSTAVLRNSAEAPGGLAWLHVHETWLSGE